MLIFDEHTYPIILDSVHTPTLTEYFWILDLNMMDFTVVPLLVLEEIIGTTIEVTVNGFSFKLPTLWHILVVDPESMILDVQVVKKLAGKQFSTLLFGPDMVFPETGTVSVSNYYPSYSLIAPSLNKHQMLCHPIGPKTWINVAPSDTFNKYLKGKVAGDLF